MRVTLGAIDKAPRFLKLPNASESDEQIVSPYPLAVSTLTYTPKPLSLYPIFVVFATEVQRSEARSQILPIYDAEK